MTGPTSPASALLPIHKATVKRGLWTPRCSALPGWREPMAEIDEQVTCRACLAFAEILDGPSDDVYACACDSPPDDDQHRVHRQHRPADNAEQDGGS